MIVHGLGYPWTAFCREQVEGKLGPRVSGESYGTAEDMLDAHAMVQRRLPTNRSSRPIFA
jgi:hypothetical protein